MFAMVKDCKMSEESTFLPLVMPSTLMYFGSRLKTDTLVSEQKEKTLRTCAGVTYFRVVIHFVCPVVSEPATFAR